MALAFGITAVAPEFVPVFFGVGYDPCIPLMGALSVVIPLICATNVIGVQYLVPSHRDCGFTASVLAGALVNILINIFAIPAFGAMGAACATVAAETTVLIVQAWLVRGELPIAQELRGVIPFVLIGFGMLLLIRATSVVFAAMSVPKAVSLISEILIGAIFYVFIAFIYCRGTNNRQFRKLFPKLAR